MILLIVQTVRLFRSITRILVTPEGRGIAVLIMLQLGLGATFYHLVEGWRWLDAFYFCVVSLTTTGFGDLAPVTDLGKIFTMVYLLTGIGLFVTFAAHVARHLLDERARRTGADGPVTP